MRRGVDGVRRALDLGERAINPDALVLRAKGVVQPGLELTEYGVMRCGQRRSRCEPCRPFAREPEPYANGDPATFGAHLCSRL
jgi:hypothetical protein